MAISRFIPISTDGTSTRWLMSACAWRTDLSRITAYYERERRGFPPHDPRMMTALHLYAYCVGVPSSRKIETRTHEDIAFRVLVGNTHPEHTCISEFRRMHPQNPASRSAIIRRSVACSVGSSSTTRRPLSSNWRGT